MPVGVKADLDQGLGLVEGVVQEHAGPAVGVDDGQAEDAEVVLVHLLVNVGGSAGPADSNVGPGSRFVHEESAALGTLHLGLEKERA